MDPTTYLAACLAAALAIIAVLSAVLARHKERSDRRRLAALRMSQALRRYAEWVNAQRLTALFHGEAGDAPAALHEARALTRQEFPELAADMADLLAAHERLAAFLAAQQALWLSDPEHWLASSHDQQFMVLWRQHQAAWQVLDEQLRSLATVRQRDLTFLTHQGRTQ